MKYYVTSQISENIHETPEGYLVCIGVPIARTGEMVYKASELPGIDGDDKGLVKIFRDEKEVFRPETMASFEGKAITIGHPNDDVGPDNWSRLAKGVLQNIRRGTGDQNNDLLADLLVTDKMAIGLVKNGLREVSCGYEADYAQTKDGKAEQKGILGNHLALVEQGRAGPGYAIKDHKGDRSMKLGEKIKAIFAKAQDEAMKIADEDPDKKDDGKVVGDKGAYDELVKIVDELKSSVASFMKQKDDARGTIVKKEGEAGDEDPDKKEDKKDDETKDDAGGLEERLAALETAVKKLLAGKSEDEDPDSEGEETEDDDFENTTMTGDSDTASRAEILAPGIEMSKDVKVKALKTAYATKEGKRIIDAFTGGKTPTYDSAEKVDVLFIAASEVLKSTRSQDLTRTKTTDYEPSLDKESPVTAEKMNEINAKYYAKRA